MAGLILASTSRYRRELFERFGVQFRAVAPGVDETPRPDEAPDAITLRLATEKALEVARRHPGDLAIGSDQLAGLDGQPLGKPGTRERAIEQLLAMSGRAVVFHTAVCLARGGDMLGVESDRTTVRFRALSRDEVVRYVDAEQPFDCAGSFKSEGRGITLFDAIETSDPTALIGLPLIATARLLRAAGVALP